MNKNNNKKLRDILNDLVKKLWSFFFLFCLLNFTSFECYIILSMVCWHFCKGMCCEGTAYIIKIPTTWVQFLVVY